MRNLLVLLCLGACASPVPTDMAAPSDGLAPRECRDGLWGKDESDIDCGGHCPPCGLGKVCSFPSDCETRTCLNRVCTDPTCSDGVANGDETGIDCGGSCPDAC